MTRYDQPEVKLFVRTAPEAGLESRKACVLEQVRSLSARDAIADYDVFPWGKEIRPDGPLREASYCEALLEHISELRDWIEENGDGDCGFDARGVTSRMTGESYDVISLPAICLSVYEGNDVVDVYPRRENGTVDTVDDGLASLAGRSVASVESTRVDD